MIDATKRTIDFALDRTKGSGMLSWLPRRRARIERTDAEAEALIHECVIRRPTLTPLTSDGSHCLEMLFASRRGVNIGRRC